MIQKKESIPQISDTYLLGQDVIWKQFNDINFYIEDTNQENLYCIILRKLFPKLRLEKIFPLNGKTNVLHEAKNNVGIKDKIFIVDKDFDDLHGKVIQSHNIFYLDRYCIENYLIEPNALMEFIIEEIPTIKKENIIKQYQFEDEILNREKELAKLFSLFFVVQKHDIPIENSSKHIGCFTQKKNQARLCDSKINQYKNEISNIVGDETWKFLEKEWCIQLDLWEKNNLITCNVGGKHLVYLVINDLKRVFKFKLMPDHSSLCYRLAKNCSFDSLLSFKANVIKYVG